VRFTVEASVKEGHALLCPAAASNVLVQDKVVTPLLWKWVIQFWSRGIDCRGWRWNEMLQGSRETDRLKRGTLITRRVIGKARFFQKLWLQEVYDDCVIQF
jgi:hypothetical protein